MNCEGYINLNIVEKYEQIGKLVHAYQNDQDFFEEIEDMLDKAVRRGLFENITIHPKPITDALKETT